jgi:hypothetical protein
LPRFVAATFTLASLLHVLVLPSGTLLSASNTDMVSEFVSSRACLTESLRHVHLALWNPFTYGGQPFLGGFESAVLYPPNLLFLCLPLARAHKFLMLLWLKCSETLRRLDLGVEIARRQEETQIPLRAAEDAIVAAAEWMRIAVTTFLSSEAQALMGIRDVGEWKHYAMQRFKGILWSNRV